MADRKITELTNITGANLADGDEFVVVDASADETKALTFAELTTALQTSLDDASGFVRITGDTMTGALQVESASGTDLFTLKNTDSSISGGENIQMNMVYGDTSSSTSWRILSRFAGSDFQLLSNIDDAGYITRFVAKENGDIQFLEDTGQSVRFRWDADEESLVLGGGSVPSGHTNAWDANVWLSNVNDEFPALLWHDNGDAFGMNTNAYYTGSAWKAIDTGASSSIYFSQGKIVLRAATSVSADADLSYNMDFVMHPSGVVSIGKDAHGFTAGSSTPLTVVNNQNGANDLMVRNTTDGTLSYSQLTLASAGSTSGYLFKNAPSRTENGGAGSLNLYNQGSYPVNIWTNGVRRMTFGGGSSIGVNQTSPSRMFEVNTTNTTSGNFNSADTSVIAITTTDNTPTAGSDRFGLSFESNANGTYRPLAGIKAIQEYTGNYDASLSFGTRGAGTLDTVVCGEKMRLRENGHLILHAGRVGSNGLGESTAASDNYLMSMVGNDTRCDLQMTSGVTMGTGASDGVQFGIQSGGAYIWNFENSQVYFGVNNTRIATIRSDNMLLRSGSSTQIVDGLADGRLDVHAGTTRNAVKAEVSTNSYICYSSKGPTTGNFSYYFAYMQNDSNTQVGSIVVDGDGTTFNTTSDRRLKDNIQAIDDASAKIMEMKPVTHTWKASPEKAAVHGFIAQEMQQIVPEAVHGEDGGDEMMSMDYGRITPVIVAALQEANEKIAQLETRIQELEAK